MKVRRQIVFLNLFSIDRVMAVTAEAGARFLVEKGTSLSAKMNKEFKVRNLKRKKAMDVNRKR